MDPKGAAGGRPRTTLGPVCASLSPSVMRICSVAHVGRVCDLCWVVHDSDDAVCIGREDAQVHRPGIPPGGQQTVAVLGGVEAVLGQGGSCSPSAACGPSAGCGP